MKRRLVGRDNNQWTTSTTKATYESKENPALSSNIEAF